MNHDGLKEMNIQNESKTEEEEVCMPNWTQCPICRDIMIDPTVFPCGHTFCRMCYQKLAFCGVKQADAGPWEQANDRVSIEMTCPTCRDKRVSQSRAIYPINFVLRDAIKNSGKDQYDKLAKRHGNFREAMEILLCQLRESKQRFEFIYTSPIDDATLLRMVKCAIFMARCDSSDFEDCDDVAVFKFNVSGQGKTFDVHPNISKSSAFNSLRIECFLLRSNNIVVQVIKKG